MTVKSAWLTCLDGTDIKRIRGNVMTWILQDGQFHTAANLMGHIRKLIKDEDFASHMTEVEGAAWFSFVDVN